MNAFETPPMADVAAERPPVEAGTWTLLFIAVALLALAGIPFWVGQQVARVDDEISQVLEPARNQATELALTQARAMTRFQRYLLTGDAESRRRYEALVVREGEISDSLESLLRRADQRTREQVLPWFTTSSSWHLAHRDAIASEQGREAFLDRVDEDQQSYDAVLNGAQRLRETLAEDMDRARQRMDGARSLQMRLTVALVALALGATVAVGFLGRRLRTLVHEAQVRGREAVRARRESDAVLEATGDGVLSVDLAGRAISLNATGTRLLGFTEEEARGRSVHELVHGGATGVADHGEDECPLMEAVHLGVVEAARDDVARHRRGRAFPIRWSLRPMMDGRRHRGAVLTLTDMTQVREAEKALQDAVKAREQTLAVVSHDLRNPLGSVSAAAELLLDVPLPEDRRRQQLEIVQRAAERMNRLIQDLLDVARIDAGALSVRPGPCEVQGLLVEVAELFEPRAVEKDLSLCIEDGVGELPPVEADRDRILQVLSNLVANALRHTGQHGVIELGAVADPDAGTVTLRVSDNGSGIPEEDRAHLFDRFWQPEHGERGGAGLGLAIVRGIVEAHGGEVGVDSEVGRGSTFRFTLPMAG